MSVQLAILIVFVLLLVAVVFSLLKIEVLFLLVIYLAVSKAVEVIQKGQA